jgi:acyl-CoA thioesterase-2
VTIEEVLGIDGAVVRPGDGWGNQWGATFGGYVAGVVMHALERAAPDGQLLSVAGVSFVQPLRTHEARVAVDVVRGGRTATSLTARLEQDGATVAVATGWTSTDAKQPQRVDVVRPHVGPPEQYEPRRWRDDTVHFVDRDFEIRPVTTDGVRTVEWLRLRRVEIGAADAWPAGALGVVADMVGAGQFRAAHAALGERHALLSLDLAVHAVAPARGPWLLGDFDNVALAHGRVIGRGELYDERGEFVASVTQQSLVRPFR